LPFAKALGMLGFGAALLAAPAAHAQVIATTPKLEAEAPTNTISGVGAVVSTTLSGFSGTGYVDYNGNDSKVSFPYTATTAGLYEVVIRYESQYDFKVGNLSVNTGPVSPVYFKSTKTGPSFLSTSKIRVQLTAGANMIIIAGGYNYYGIDYIQVAPVSATPTLLTPAATTGRVEAEAGQLFYTQALVKDGDASTSYSGTGGYVSGFSETASLGSSITLPVTVATAGLYQVAVGARGNFDGKSFDTSVATGTATTSGKLTTSLGMASTAFQSFVVGKYNLAAGTTTITITSQTSYLDVDYVDITATTGVATAAKASAEAQKALSAYPNPTNGQALSVSLELANAQETTFDLVNSMGQRVSSSTRSLRAGTNQLQVPTAGVAGGIYQLVVRGGDQPSLVQRVVIN
jgi:hypothetical protein